MPIPPYFNRAADDTDSKRYQTVFHDPQKAASVAAPTQIFIYLRYQFNVIDNLLTNFHFPESTLLMQVPALAGRDNVLKAYEHVIQEKYRFLVIAMRC